MKVLLIGGDTRLHAVAKAVSRSKHLTELYAAPGNAGIAELAVCVPIAEIDAEKLIAFASEKKIDFAFISAELPIALGVADFLRDAGIVICAPSKAASRLEWDKLFACNFARENNIPSPIYAATNVPENVRLVSDCLRFAYGSKRVASNGKIVTTRKKGLGGVFFKANGRCDAKGRVYFPEGLMQKLITRLTNWSLKIASMTRRIRS